MAWTKDQLEAAIDDWKSTLVEEGRAPGTITTYVGDARRFLHWLTGQQPTRVRPSRYRTSAAPAGARLGRRRVGALIPAPEPLRALVGVWADGPKNTQKGIAWPRHRWAAAFPDHADVLRRLPDRLDRAAVRHVAQRASETPAVAEAAFVVILTWGFGRVGYGPHRTRRVLDSTPQSADLLHAVARTLADDGAVAAYRRLAGDCRLRFLGPAFGTKYLAFCQPANTEPVALIHDALVSAWLARHGRPDLTAATWSVPMYEAYLDQLHRWSVELAVHPETIEFLIFQDEATRQGNQWSE